MSAKPRVLLVEDEPEIRRFVKSALEAMGCVVTEADSVMSATHVLSVNPADLLVVDLGLPDVDGQTLIERVRMFEGLAQASGLMSPLNLGVSAVPARLIDLVRRGWFTMPPEWHES